ncbi:MAG: glutathione ABC transporter permease GsiD, partial [Bacillati bacterium ANGP1]
MARRFARNRLAVLGLIVFVVIVLAALLAPWGAPFSPVKTDFTATLQAPGPRHPLGTDELGR